MSRVYKILLLLLLKKKKSQTLQWCLFPNIDFVRWPGCFTSEAWKTKGCVLKLLSINICTLLPYWCLLSLRLQRVSKVLSECVSLGMAMAVTMPETKASAHGKSTKVSPHGSSSEGWKSLPLAWVWIGQFRRLTSICKTSNCISHPDVYDLRPLTYRDLLPNLG